MTKDPNESALEKARKQIEPHDWAEEVPDGVPGIKGSKDLADTFALVSIAEGLEKIAKNLDAIRMTGLQGWIDGGTIPKDQQVKAP